MKIRSFLVAALIVVLPLQVSLAAPPANLKLSADTCDFGIARPWTTVMCDYTVTNGSNRALKLRSALGSPELLETSDLPVLVKAKDEAQLRLTFRLGGAVGRRGLHLPIHVFGSEDAPVGDFVLHARGYVYSELDDVKPELDFGVVEAGKPNEKRLALRSSDVSNLRILKVLDAPAFVNARVSEDGRAVIVAIDSDAPWGLQGGLIRVGLSTPEEPVAGILVKADVHGKIVPNTNPSNMGVLRKGNDNEVLIRLADISGKDIRVGKIELDGILGKTSTEPCQPARHGCLLVKLRVDDAQPTGNLVSSLHVELPDYSKVLTIGLQGVLLLADANIQDLTDKLNESEQHDSTDASSSVRTSQAFNAALRKAMEKPKLPPPPPPGDGPLLRWEVANQDGLYGYLIYRASAENGKFLRVNKDIIQVSGENGSASNYAWRDTSAESGKTYWYYIGTLSNDGTKKKLSEPQKVIAK